MSLIYREHKGAPLTATEVDENFRGLDQRLKALEESPTRGEGIGNVSLKEGVLYVHGTEGSLMGKIPLPLPPLAPSFGEQEEKDKPKVEGEKIPKLPLYLKETIPVKGELGELALLVQQGQKPRLIYGTGEGWQALKI